MCRSVPPMLIRCTILILVLLLGLPAEAAEPEFPPGSRIGLVPPPGMVPSKAFQGFEDRERNAAILFLELVGDAFAEIERNFTVEALKAQGIEVEAREDIPRKDGRAFLVIAHQDVAGTPLRKWALVATEHQFTAIVSVQIPNAARDAYPDAALRASLATFTTRAAVPLQEQLDLLPYSLRELAGFRIVRAAANGAALLTDGPKDAIEFKEQPLLLITFVPSGSEQSGDRDSLARRVISQTPGVKDMRVVRSEGMRIGGQAGHEIVADARDATTDTDLRLVQWLRFGASASLWVLCVVRKDDWDQMYPRFRAVRDGIEPK